MTQQVMTDYQLARLIFSSIKIRENSWYCEEQPNRYTKPLRICVIEAFFQEGLTIFQNEHFISLTYILLSTTWSDTVEWAENVLSKYKEETTAAQYNSTGELIKERTEN